MDINYNLDNVKDKDAFLNQISKYEEELSIATGNEVILVAYTKPKHGIAY